MTKKQIETQEILVNMGPQHPSTHGVFRMVLSVDGELVTDVTPYIGYLHRGAEKLCETMDYRQGIGFMDRTEYLANFNAELSYVMAVERLLDIEVPERANWIRMILVELNRLSSHFMFVGAFGVAALLTPPDLISQVGLGVPIIILYEISIRLAAVMERKRNNNDDDDDPDDPDDTDSPLKNTKDNIIDDIDDIPETDFSEN